MEPTKLVVRGAREHNLRNVNLELPKNALIVFTGVSGSGKSSMAFDTLYAEGQRRYVESLSAYARQFLEQLPKPDVDSITGLAPAISIQQKTASRNPRSTVGTITEISDYLRVLYARVGLGHCPRCDRPITAQSTDQIVDRVLALPEGTRFLVLAPVVRGQKGEYKDLFADMAKRGYIRARVNGMIVRLADEIKLDKKSKHSIEVVIDRLQNRKVSDAAYRTRVSEAVEQALGLAEGNLIISVEKDAEAKRAEGADENEADLLLSSQYACVHCGISYDRPTPQLFSFNSPFGMCMTCEGLGTQYTFDPDLLIPNTDLSFYDGAIPLVGSLKKMGRWRRHIYEGVASFFDFDLKTPWNQLARPGRDALLYGSGDTKVVWEWKSRGGKMWKHSAKWEGIVPQLLSQYKKAGAGPRAKQLERLMKIKRCPTCGGHRLNAQARAVRVGGETLIELGTMPIGELVPWFEALDKTLPKEHRVVAESVLKDILARVSFLRNVGLHYLTLDRAAPTLSGGEAQRIRLARQLGSGLVGVLYILDEPSIGLHPRDNERLLRSLENLRDQGNTVIVVEHDEDTMRAANYIVDFGPGPGSRGGHVVAAGKVKEILKKSASLTGQYLAGKKSIEVPTSRRLPTDRAIRIVGARQNNLKNITAEIPLGLFVCVTGVSGSGKSTLINDVLREALLSRGKEEVLETEENGDAAAHEVGSHDRIEGDDLIDKLIDIDQSPIGRTPRSNPATYIKVWDAVRTIFAAMPDAKIRGYKPARFSFNRPGGRCEACEGNGSTKLDMDFLADMWVTCKVCDGKRFNHETLHVRYRGKTIHDVLELEVGEAMELFEHVEHIHTMLKSLYDVGLDYIKLGQPAPTLSGGEAQRVKLARELCRKSTGKTLYILDEPTTGLHIDDISKLLKVLHGFVTQGNTVLLIEHHLDVIKTADWIIDMGPEGGAEGGRIVTTGTPEKIMKCKGSHTGEAMAKLLKGT